MLSRRKTIRSARHAPARHRIATKSKSTSSSLIQYTFVASKIAKTTASPIAGTYTAALERPCLIVSLCILRSIRKPFSCSSTAVSHGAINNLGHRHFLEHRQNGQAGNPKESGRTVGTWPSRGPSRLTAVNFRTSGNCPWISRSIGASHRHPNCGHLHPNCDHRRRSHPNCDCLPNRRHCSRRLGGTG